MTGLLITVEGVDGAGKTTLARALAEALRGQGLPVTLLHEPGSEPLGERIRELVQGSSVAVVPRAEALLYAAARAQLVETVLRPKLDEGQVVVMDRFLDSSLAYQGGGRELGIEPIQVLNRFATCGLRPHRTLLLAVTPGIALGRLAGTQDRLERAGLPFFEKVAAAYDRLAQIEPERIRRLDATCGPETLLAAALAAVADLFEAPTTSER